MKMKNKNEQHNMWDATAEVLIAMLSLRLSKIRDINRFDICKQLNYDLLRKKLEGNIQHYSATPNQRAILNETGY